MTRVSKTDSISGNFGLTRQPNLKIFLTSERDRIGPEQPFSNRNMG